MWWQLLGLDQAWKMFSELMLSLSFFVGIMLMVSQEAFDYFNKALAREMGLKKRIVPKIEDMHVEFIDFLLLKYRFVAGLVITVASFLLLLLYR